MKRALVVFCHPARDSFVGAALDTVLGVLEEAGVEHRLHDLYADGFRPELNAEEHAAHLSPGADASVQRYADDLGWCDTLLLVYPTWWSGQPAMLKGWVDRVWVNGVAWDLPDGARRVRPRLTNIRRLVAVTTHGSSKLVNAAQGEGGKRTLTRSMRTMCHRLARAHWIALYGVDTCSERRRRSFLASVERRIRALSD
jgi:NAD(P)H dehydrogenase (quinone)